MNALLPEAPELILGALGRLVTRPESRHPFVIAEQVGSPAVFVQWATKDGVLLFDVPWLGLTEPCTVESGTLRGIEVLSSRVPPDGRVLVTEYEDEEPPGTGILARLLLGRG